MRKIAAFVLVTCISAISTGICLSGTCSAEPTEKESTAAAKKTLRVGVFDSRAVALAYYREFLRSKEFTEQMKKLTEERDKAKAAGDEKKYEEIKALGRAQQEKNHFQIFGSAPIDEIVAKLQKQLPGIAEKAGVDVIVSKWSLAYQSPDAEFVDVTELMAEPFHPDEKTLKIMQEMKKHKPHTPEQLEKLKNDPHF